MSQATLTKEEVRQLRNHLSEEGKKIMTEKFGEDLFKWDPIKDCLSLEDACAYNGSKIEDVIPWKEPKNADQRCVNAFASFIEIYRAFNNGEVPVWGSGTPYKYSVWVYMPTPSGAGLSFFAAVSDFSIAYVPARLTLFNRDHVKIIFERFPKLMEDLMVYKK